MSSETTGSRVEKLHVGMDVVLEVCGNVTWTWPEWIPTG